VEDFVHWSPVTSPKNRDNVNARAAKTNSSRVFGITGTRNKPAADRSRDTTPHGGLDLRRQSSTSTLVGADQGAGNSTSSTSHAHRFGTTNGDGGSSSVESLHSSSGSSNNSGQRGVGGGEGGGLMTRMNGHGGGGGSNTNTASSSGSSSSSNVTPIRRLVERNLLKTRHAEFFLGDQRPRHQQRQETASPSTVSLSSFRSERGMGGVGVSGHPYVYDGAGCTSPTPASTGKVSCLLCFLFFFLGFSFLFDKNSERTLVLCFRSICLFVHFVCFFHLPLGVVFLETVFSHFFTR
jgi:hypothetical protein